MKVVLATKNLAKFNEFEELASGTKLDLIPVKSKEFCLPDETGSSFQENAFLKANFTYRKLQVPVLADDSGLEVDYLKGKPGVYSARYSKMGTDRENIKKLLSELKGITKNQRTARFKCCLVLITDNEGQAIFCEGILEGLISEEPKGNGGFGYDPIFFLPHIGLNLAEIKKHDKNLLSHRGKAFKALIEKLKKPD